MCGMLDGGIGKDELLSAARFPLAAWPHCPRTGRAPGRMNTQVKHGGSSNES